MQKPMMFVNLDSPVAQFVQETVNNHKVVIFSKSYCPYCSMAKEQFRKLEVAMTVVELDLRPDGDEIQTVLGELTGASTVPRCFINGKFIGGGTDVKRLYEEGLLQKYFQ